MTSRATNPLPHPLEQLVDAMLRAHESDADGELDVFLVAAAAKALTEHGIKAHSVSANVVLDPEQWERPHSMVALKVRGRIYGGRGRYGWEAIAEAMAAHKGIDGGYREIGRSYQVDWESLESLNPGRTARLNEALGQCRALVEQWQLDKHTPAPRRRGPGGAPRL